MRRQRKKPEYQTSNWTTEQDCYLIEHSSLPNDDLAKHLQFSVEDIVERKELLGLLRRARQIQRGV